MPWENPGDSDEKERKNILYPQDMTSHIDPSIVTLNIVIKLGMSTGECGGLWHPINNPRRRFLQNCLSETPGSVHHLPWGITLTDTLLLTRFLSFTGTQIVFSKWVYSLHQIYLQILEKNFVYLVAKVLLSVWISLILCLSALHRIQPGWLSSLYFTLPPATNILEMVQPTYWPPRTDLAEGRSVYEWQGCPFFWHNDR